jgi:hypothetical protein
LTRLLGRLLPLFTGTRRFEDLFTEAVARLFERRPEVCLSWLDGLEVITPARDEVIWGIMTRTSYYERGGADVRA